MTSLLSLIADSHMFYINWQQWLMAFYSLVDKKSKLKTSCLTNGLSTMHWECDISIYSLSPSFMWCTKALHSEHNDWPVWWDSWHCLRCHPTKVMENWILLQQYVDIRPSLLYRPKRAQIHITWRKKLIISHTDNTYSNTESNLKKREKLSWNRFLFLILFILRESLT